MSAEPVEPDSTGPEFIGPFESYCVILYGRRVPFLQAWPVNGGRVHLLLDERYGLDLTLEEAQRVVPFIADCMAVAAGYTCHPRPDEDPKRLLPFPRVSGINAF